MEHRKSRITRRAIAAVLVSGLGVAVYALLIGASGPSAQVQTVTSTPANVAAQFSVLTQGQTPSGVSGASAPSQEFGTFSANLALARQVQAADVEERVYDPMLVVPGANSICLVHRFDMSGTCVSLADAMAGKSVTWAACLPGLEPGQVRVTGLVPDGVSTVTLQLSDGTQQTASPADNFYDFVTPGSNALPVSVAFSSDGQSHVVPTATDQSEVPPTCAQQYGWSAP